MFAGAAAALLVAFALAILRAIKGPTVFDRVLAGNTVGSLAILLLAVFGFLTGRPEFLDIGADIWPPQSDRHARRAEVLPSRRSRP